MLTPNDPSPNDPPWAGPEAAAAVLSDALASLGGGRGSMSRDAALGAFRRHLARIQLHVQEAFETQRLTGLAGRAHAGALTDGLIVALHGHATSQIHAR